jgi:carbon-monoxide dehydrogenase medium subunit
VKPPDFEYHRPETVAETVSILSELAPEARVLAGGQSLIPMLNMRLAAPAHIVDVNRVAGLSGVEVANGHVEVGALVRQRALEVHEEAATACPLLRQALVHVAHRPIRSRGTVVGSIVHADPAAELPAVLAVLGGRVIARGPGGEREIAAEDFFAGWFETALEPGELATAVRFARLAPGERSAFVEMARRAGDFALCAAAAVVSESTARVALAGVGQRPSVHDVSGLLHGDAEAALDELAGALDPAPDIHASADFRRHLAREMTRRAVAAARDEGRTG